MSWKEKLRMLFAKEAIVFKNKDTPNILQDFIEALLKETEQNTAKEILHDLEEYNYGGRYYEVSLEYIEQLREKYKGVE